MQFNGIEILTDAQGYLINHQHWCDELAVEIARLEKIKLSEAHWEIIRFVRNFYLQYNTSPTVRMLIQAMSKSFGETKVNSRYLFRLFPQGPAKQATKIAGLPKPVKCL
ncbi:TusE/DsrC/DsvC family sulfur relay protein [Candidatus Hoaglandella endobia]|uniref:Sulfurtransferase n=1 Tax=Candidatus Hoaglandella endobia TaxID=1778263 RepID=A0A143WU89_9ENTR|nr:TusE/DsrC/DsvC family sulfur relay protein [Candidatus Hoaglandella endobia]CUX97275.1 Sulfurtransferase TusE [Candidatus Hoaglandella endobia]